MNLAPKKILLVEDELLIAKDIKRMLSPKYDVVCIAKSYEEAVHTLDNKQIDLAILDITLKGEKTGVDIAEYINQENNIPFIYLTALTNEGVLEELKGTKPSAYISKPVIKVNLLTTLDIVFANQKEKAIYLQVGKKVLTFDLEKIACVKAEHVYLRVCMAEEERLIRYSLSKFLTDVNHKLIQINRSTAINPKFISKITAKEAIVGKESLSVSPKYRERLLESLGLLES